MDSLQDYHTSWRELTGQQAYLNGCFEELMRLSGFLRGCGGVSPEAADHILKRGEELLGQLDALTPLFDALEALMQAHSTQLADYCKAREGQKQLRLLEATRQKNNWQALINDLPKN